jgi:hypothetical protein
MKGKRGAQSKGNYSEGSTRRRAREHEGLRAQGHHREKRARRRAGLGGGGVENTLQG